MRLPEWSAWSSVPPELFFVQFHVTLILLTSPDKKKTSGVYELSTIGDDSTACQCLSTFLNTHTLSTHEADADLPAWSGAYFDFDQVATKEKEIGLCKCISALKILIIDEIIWCFHNQYDI